MVCVTGPNLYFVEGVVREMGETRIQTYPTLPSRTKIKTMSPLHGPLPNQTRKKVVKAFPGPSLRIYDKPRQSRLLAFK